MILRTLMLLLVLVCCTDKPDAVSPSESADQQPALVFSGLDGALKPNETFTVIVSISGDLSASGNAAQTLTIVLSKRVGTGDWEKVEEKVAANSSASFELTLPAGTYALKAETKGAATLSKESNAFTVSTAEVDGIKLSFTEDSYTIKSGALFDITVEVTESEKLADDSSVVLKLLKDDDSETGMLMQWRSKDDMQSPGEAVTALVDKDDGKAEFKDLFIVDDKDAAKLQAVLEHGSESLTAEGDLSSESGDVRLTKVTVTDQQKNRLTISIAPPPDEASKMITTQLYFFNDSGDMLGEHGGSGQYSSGLSQEVDQNTSGLDLDKDCYEHLALKLVEFKYAFLMDIDSNFNGNPNCG